MELKEYICKMISQECEDILKFTRDNSDGEHYGEVLMARLNRLNGFVHDFNRYCVK